MENDPRGAGAWPQGRNPHRRKVGVLGWALLLMVLLVLFLLGPR
ncbi:hypothetical protein [Streptomyces sp. NPDC001985]